MASGREKREELVSAARRDIEMETKRSLERIRKEVADLTVLATEKVTRKTLYAEDHKTDTVDGRITGNITVQDEGDGE